MELTFLVDNNTLVDSYFLAEPALSIFIEDGDKRILFDAGYSDVFLTNARRKGLGLLNLDWVVLSHGHLDHTWGLDALIRHRLEAASEQVPCSRPKMLAHPKAFMTKRHESLPEIGMLIAEEKMAQHFDLTLTTEPIWLSDTLVTLGQIERVLDFEKPSPIGKRIEPAGSVDDTIPDDTAMAYITDNGLVVIAGCAHAGICNTVEQAKRITGVDRVHTVLGGFHLQNAKSERLDPTVQYLGDLNLDSLYACHCTDLAAKIALAHTCPIKEVGAGLTLEF